MQIPASEFVNQISRAGAGAGKTTQLTLKVVELVREKIKTTGEGPKLVVTTFTRKATQELRERLVAKALEINDPALVQYMNSRSKLQISTIHGVLALFLSRYGHLIGLDSQFSFQSELNSKKWVKKALREALLVSENSSLLLETYRFEDLEQMVLRFYENWMTSSELQFVSKDSMWILRDQKIKVLAKTCAEVASQILSETSHPSWEDCANRLKTCSEVLTAWEQEGAASLDAVLEGWRLPSAKIKEGASGSTQEDVKDLKSELKEFSENSAYQNAYIETHETLCRAFADFGVEFVKHLFALKMNSASLSMSDLEGLSLQVLIKHPEAGAKFAKEWDYWLIDEYQDTSPLQVRLLKSLVGESNQYVVGDPQQSIYLFRGARTEVFLEKESEMAEKKGLFKPLMKNYRSQKPLLEFFNDYFSKVSPQFSKMEAAGPEAAEEKPKVAQVLVCAEDEEKESSEIEASAVLFRVQELLKGGTEPEQIAILARKNAQLAAIAEKAEQVGIPVQLHASARFFDRIEIRDALALLKFLVNPHDNLNLLCLLRSPWLRVPDAVIAQHCDKKAFSYWTHLSRSGEPAIERLKGLLVRSRSESVSQLWLQQLVDLGFFDSCLLHDSTGKREANLWKVVHSLFHQERQNGFSYNAFIQEAKWAMESGLSDESDAIPVIESRRINLMTVHASKGLQFKHVILPFFGKAKTGIDTSILTFDSTKKYWSLKIPNSSGKLESSLVTDDWKAELAKREKEESDRVLYVAMTRAQETISLVWHQKVEKGSWAAAFPYKLEEGVHSLDLFSYEIRKGFFSPELTPKKILQVSEISKPWQKELREFVEERTSFSEQNKIDLTKMVSKAFLNLTKASHRGIFMHKVMESIKFNSEEDLKKWVQSEVPAKEVESTLKALDFILTLSEPNLLSIVKNGAAEWGFTYTREGRRVQGQIDLWGRDETGKLWVVDYKTGSSEFEAKAFEQLDSYVNALQICKKTKPGEQVARVVIYPFEQKVVIACTYRSPGKTNR